MLDIKSQAEALLKIHPDSVKVQEFVKSVDKIYKDLIEHKEIEDFLSSDSRKFSVSEQRIKDVIGSLAKQIEETTGRVKSGLEVIRGRSMERTGQKGSLRIR